MIGIFYCFAYRSDDTEGFVKLAPGPFDQSCPDYVCPHQSFTCLAQKDELGKTVCLVLLRANPRLADSRVNLPTLTPGTTLF